MTTLHIKLTCTCIDFHPGRVEQASNMLVIEEDTLGFDWGKGPKSNLDKRPVCLRFSTDSLTEWIEAAALSEQTSPRFSPESLKPGCSPNTVGLPD